MLNAIIDWSLHNRFLVLAGAIVFIALGAWSLSQLDIDAFPDTTPVQVQINTIAPGLAPEEVERQITFPIEQAINGLPRLQQLLKKVVAVHGAAHPELAAIQQIFQSVSEELSSHMMKEEHILFPYIVALETAVSTGRPKPRPAFGTVSNPVRMMELEIGRAHV